jgi:hypothetical protein
MDGPEFNDWEALSTDDGEVFVICPDCITPEEKQAMDEDITEMEEAATAVFTDSGPSDDHARELGAIPAFLETESGRPGGRRGPPPRQGRELLVLGDSRTRRLRREGPLLMSNPSRPVANRRLLIQLSECALTGQPVQRVIEQEISVLQDDGLAHVQAHPAGQIGVDECDHQPFVRSAHRRTEVARGSVG